jgi:hypothetical protein
MPISLEAVWIAPVKSLALQRVDRAHLTDSGIRGDRAFFIVDERGRLFSQRECGALVQVQAHYDVERDGLELRFPDGAAAAGRVEDGDPLTAIFFGKRETPGVVVRGPWSDALSRFAGQRVRLVRAVHADAFDAMPLSLCSRASVDHIRDGVPSGVTFDERRFRQNLVLAGAIPFEEDAWIGRRVAIGAAVVTPRLRDSRCVITTHDPVTGEADFDTLGHITSKRADQPKQVNFGMYASVDQPGEIAVGDAVAALEEVGA